MAQKRLNHRQAAALGAYVYCYLREDGSPYYVGIGKTITRPIEKHNAAQPPRDRDRIRIMRSSLKWEEACKWEVFYIAHYGRKDLGTGILRNLTDGGEGAPGCIPSSETRQKMAKSQTGRRHSEETKKRMSESQKGRTFSLESRAKMSQTRKGKPSGGKGVSKNPESVKKMIEKQSAPAAERMGVPVSWYSALPKLEKIRARRASAKHEIYGQALLDYMNHKHDRQGNPIKIDD